MAQAEGLAPHSRLDHPLGRSAEPPPYLSPGPAVRFELPPAPSGRTAANATGRYAIRHYAFSGNTVVDTATLEKIAEGFTGTEVTVAQLEELRQRLTRCYIEQGYVTSGAIVPDHPLQNGVFHFQIVEGKLKLEDVCVTGNERLREGYIKGRLWPDPETPLHGKTLEQNLRRLLADPLIAKINGHLRPGGKLGESLLDVEVTRARAYQLSLFANNFRPPSVGAEAGGVSGWVRNLTGLGDFLGLTFTFGAGVRLAAHAAGGRAIEQ